MEEFKEKLKRNVSVALAILAVASAVFIYKICSDRLDISQTKTVELSKELRYFKEASILNDYYYKFGKEKRVEIIVDILKAIDSLLPTYFPEGPFKREDLIAIAMLESSFYQFERGSSGEKGIFQIMPGEFKNLKIKHHHYDIDLNTDMALRVLKRKYKRHPDYKKAIIAYNGVVRKKDGRWSEKYWKAFLIRRNIVDHMQKELQLP